MSDLQWVCSVQSNSFVGAEPSGRRRRRGRGPSGTPKFLSPTPPLSLAASCLGGGSSMERRFCLRIASQRVFRTNFLPHPPAPFPEGRGNFIVLFCREASPPAPRVPGGCTLYKGKHYEVLAFLCQFCGCPRSSRFYHGVNGRFLQTSRLFAKHSVPPASSWISAQISVCREVACPLGTASETAREGKHLFSVRAISDIVRT